MTRPKLNPRCRNGATSPPHRHRWVYDGTMVSGVLIYHCDEHDPPIVRLVSPAAAYREDAGIAERDG